MNSVDIYFIIREILIYRDVMDYVALFKTSKELIGYMPEWDESEIFIPNKNIYNMVKYKYREFVRVALMLMPKLNLTTIRIIVVNSLASDKVSIVMECNLKRYRYSFCSDSKISTLRLLSTGKLYSMSFPVYNIHYKTLYTNFRPYRGVPKSHNFRTSIIELFGFSWADVPVYERKYRLEFVFSYIFEKHNDIQIHAKWLAWCVLTSGTWESRFAEMMKFRCYTNIRRLLCAQGLIPPVTLLEKISLGSLNRLGMDISVDSEYDELVNVSYNNQSYVAILGLYESSNGHNDMALQLAGKILPCFEKYSKFLNSDNLDYLFDSDSVLDLPELI